MLESQSILLENCTTDEYYEEDVLEIKMKKIA